MNQEHLSQEDMLSFTHGLLDGQKADSVSAHLQVCGTCHQQQTQMAMAATFAKMNEISQHNQQWTCSDPFWGPPYPNAQVTPPPSTNEIRKWEAQHKLRLPATLAHALRTQNGGYVRGTEIVICPLQEFQLISESKWDPVFRFDQIVSERDKLLYIGFEGEVPADIILSYAQSSEPAVLYLWHDLGDELRQQADSFDALTAAWGAELDPTPSPTPQASLWVTSVGPNFGKVFAVVRRAMSVAPSEAKALLSGPAFRVAVGWPSELKLLREALQGVGATAEIR